MSDLLNQASLVMVPSGYKEDTVYSVVPSDGSGDLSFTRASNGTRINSAGLVEVCPWNDLTYSEDFTNAVWTKITATVTANSTTAPNGTNTATKFESTGSGVPQLSQSITGTNTISIYAKAGNISSFRMWIGSEVIFDLSTGTVTAGTATMENVGNGWYRCIISSTSAGAFNPYFVSTASGQFVYIWGAQVNIGSTAKPYFPTTDRLNVPRLTYQNGGGGCPSLLLEKQSTNFQTYSQDFTNAAWTKLGQGVGDTSVVTANYAISPDGTQNATRFVCNLNGGTTSSDRSWMIASFTAQATSTISIWIKLNSAGTKTVLLSDSGGGTKTISGTEWQRIDATFVGAGGEFRIGLIGGSTSDTLDCCIWGAQAESGTYPTSYIPTTSASATRVADACFKTGISSLIGQTQGTMFIDTYVGNETDEVYGWLQASLSGNPNDSIQVNRAGSNIQCQVYVGSTVQGIITGGTITKGQRIKVAVGYKQNDLVLYLNGTQIGVDTSTDIPTCAVFQLGAYPPLPNDYTNDGGINQAVLFPTRLSNSELASLTSL